jgi:hypothetical protein
MKVVTGMSINAETVEGLKKLAKLQNRTFSNLCETILSEYIRENLKEPVEVVAPQSPTLKRRTSP